MIPGRSIVLIAIIVTVIATVRPAICRTVRITPGTVAAIAVAAIPIALIIIFIPANARAARTATIIIVPLVLGIALLGIARAIILTIVLVIALGARLVLTDFVIIDDAEIMVGELQEIFLLYAVAVMLSVLSQLFIRVEQLGRVAARPAVDPGHLVAATATASAALWTIVITTATAVIIVHIAIIVQGSVFPHSWPSAAKTTGAASRTAWRARLNAGHGAPPSFTSSDCARAA